MKEYAKLWLDYTPKKNNRECEKLKKFTFTGAKESDIVLQNAVSELKAGLSGMLGIEPEVIIGPAGETVVISCGKDMQDAEEYTVSISGDGLKIESKSSSGILYGVFDVLRTIACEKKIEEVYGSGRTVRPSQPLRMLDHWDNMDGSIERGYSGESSGIL